MQQVLNAIKNEILLLTEILKTITYLDHSQMKGKSMKDWEGRNEQAHKRSRNEWYLRSQRKRVLKGRQ